MNEQSRTHRTPTLDTVECQHCRQMVADRPYPPPEDDAAWEQEARDHLLGCAAILSGKARVRRLWRPSGRVATSTAAVIPCGSPGPRGSTDAMATDLDGHRTIRARAAEGRRIAHVYDCDHGWKEFPSDVRVPDKDKLFTFDLPLGKGKKERILVLDNYGDEVLPDRIRRQVLNDTMFANTIGIHRKTGEIVHVGFFETNGLDARHEGDERGVLEARAEWWRRRWALRSEEVHPASRRAEEQEETVLHLSLRARGLRVHHAMVVVRGSSGQHRRGPGLRRQPRPGLGR